MKLSIAEINYNEQPILENYHFKKSLSCMRTEHTFA